MINSIAGHIIPSAVAMEMNLDKVSLDPIECNETSPNDCCPDSNHTQEINSTFQTKFSPGKTVCVCPPFRHFLTTKFCFVQKIKNYNNRPTNSVLNSLVGTIVKKE